MVIFQFDSKLVSMRTLNSSENRLQTYYFIHVKMKTMTNVIMTNGCHIYFDGGICDGYNR